MRVGRHGPFRVFGKSAIDHIRVEIRAAEIAADPDHHMTFLEWCGFEKHASDCLGGDDQVAYAYAGWLAREIMEHGTATHDGATVDIKENLR